MTGSSVNCDLLLISPGGMCLVLAQKRPVKQLACIRRRNCPPMPQNGSTGLFLSCYKRSSSSITACSNDTRSGLFPDAFAVLAASSYTYSQYSEVCSTGRCRMWYSNTARYIGLYIIKSSSSWGGQMGSSHRLPANQGKSVCTSS